MGVFLLGTKKNTTDMDRKKTDFTDQGPEMDQQENFIYLHFTTFVVREILCTNTYDEYRSPTLSGPLPTQRPVDHFWKGKRQPQMVDNTSVVSHFTSGTGP